MIYSAISPLPSSLAAAAWSCVATCFFIDTARNVIVYLENIFRMLQPGGYWINFGIEAIT